jgi:hypothetical protein
VTAISASQAMGFWIKAGGAYAVCQVAAGVATAESGLRTDATNTAGDVGLWQINDANFGGLGVTRDQMLDPLQNAMVAVRMSANGTNWRDWCTCYVGGACPAVLSNMGTPRPGSPAYAAWQEYVTLKTLPSAADRINPYGSAQYGPTPVATPAETAGDWGTPTPQLDQVSLAWGEVQNFHHQWATGTYDLFSKLSSALRGLIT